MKGEGNKNSTNLFNAKQIPDKLKPLGNSLLSFLKNEKIVKWNSKGQLINKSIPIKCSNIINLIIHSLTNTNKKPIGYKFFYNKLKKFKIPYFLKINNLRKYTNEKDYDEWRPPGILYKKSN